MTARRDATTEVSAALRIGEREAEQLVADSDALVHQLPHTLNPQARQPRADQPRAC